MASQPASHGLQYHARSIAAQIAEKGVNRWLAGTTVIGEDNEIQLLELDKDKDRLTATQTFAHKHEIWSIVPSPSNPSQFITTYTNGVRRDATLWTMPSEGPELQSEAQLNPDGGHVAGVAWSSMDRDTIAVVRGGGVSIQRLSEGTSELVQDFKASDGSSFCGPSDWSKSEASTLSTATLASSILIWDTRSTRQAASKDQAHTSTIRCLKFASGDSHYLASCGSDCKAKVWDIRVFKAPLVTLGDHAHWVWQCEFNPGHDQMLLTASSDATVKLHHIPKLGKTATRTPPVSTPGSQHWHGSEASCCSVFDGHDDSVYGVAWSHVDPWVLASVSYDGRVIISRVPSNIKYNILI